MSEAPKVDPEFKALLPALTPDQRAGLERDVLAHGIISPLVVWEGEGVLLDGHNRLEIAERESLPFRTVGMSFATREAAVEWIFAHQRDRRNLTPDQLALVMGRHYNRTKKKDHSYLVGNQHAKRGFQKEDAVTEAGSTDEKLAKEYGVTPVTIWRNGKFAAAVETLKAVDPDIEQKVVTGKGPTRKAVITAAEVIDDEVMARAILAGDQRKDGHKQPAITAKHGPPSDGMRRARQAAGILNEIRNDDIEKAEAFAFMRRWLDAHEA